MNILFIGPYRQNDGWGLAAKSYIRALASTKHNLSICPNFLATVSPNTQLEDDLKQYESSRYSHYDMVIQKTLPHSLFLNKKISKNIGLFVLETNDISHSECINNINTMDEIWVPSEQEKKCLLKSNVTTNIKVISQPLDTDLIHKVKDYKLDLGSSINQTVKFYFIGEYIERKNIKDLVTAFNLAFDSTQPVSLIIKTSLPGKSSGESRVIIEQEIDKIKQKLSIGQRHKKEIVITERLSYEEILGLHNACDFFVMPSYGEAFCRPAAEALCLGKTPIVTENTGTTDFVNNENGFIVKSYRSPVICNNRPVSNDIDIYTANEYWYQISIYDLIDKMRKAYDMHKNHKIELKNKQQIGINSLSNFSYSEIGNKLCI